LAVVIELNICSTIFAIELERKGGLERDGGFRQRLDGIEMERDRLPRRGAPDGLSFFELGMVKVVEKAV
jgi:hypothetical protein